MGADFSHATLVQHDDAIGLLDRRETMRDDDARPMLEEPLEGLTHENLRVGVDVRRRLVEDEHSRIVNERAREGDELLLARGEGRAALLDLFLEPCGRLAPTRPRFTAAAAAATASSEMLLVAEADVRGNRAREQVDVLEHHAELAPQRLELPVANVDTVDEDAALLDVVEPHEEAHQRGLSRARCGPRSRPSPRDSTSKIDVAQDPVVAVVGERDVLEPKRARARSSESIGSSRRSDRGLGVEQA